MEPTIHSVSHSLHIQIAIDESLNAKKQSVVLCQNFKLLTSVIHKKVGWMDVAQILHGLSYKVYKVFHILIIDSSFRNTEVTKSQRKFYVRGLEN